MTMNTKLKSIIIAACALFAACANAQDKQTLDLLVSKGVISREEADNVAKSSVQISAKEKATKKITISGRIQGQYQFLNSEQNNDASSHKASTNGFQMRRLYLGVNADMGAGWSGTLVMDFAKSGVSNGADYLADAFITKKVALDYLTGAADIGYKKVNFAFEENTSSSKLLSIERSLATRYFVESQKAASNGNLGFGSRYTGAYWNGSVEALKGFEYGIAVTNSQNYSIKPATANAAGVTAENNLNFWGNALYKTKIDDVALKFGLNFGYGPGANSVTNDLHGAIIGVNPYAEVKYEGLTVWGDFLFANVEYGKRNVATTLYEDANPFGFNMGAEYRFDIGELGAIGPAFHYSYLNTDGRGVRISDAMFGASNVDTSTAASNMYDNAHTIYIGANWYIIGNSLKLQAGYEWARFAGAPAGEAQNKRADVNAVRVQMQVIF